MIDDNCYADSTVRSQFHSEVWHSFWILRFSCSVEFLLVHVLLLRLLLLPHVWISLPYTGPDTNSWCIDRDEKNGTLVTWFHTSTAFRRIPGWTLYHLYAFLIEIITCQNVWGGFSCQASWPSFTFLSAANWAISLPLYAPSVITTVCSGCTFNCLRGFFRPYCDNVASGSDGFCIIVEFIAPSFLVRSLRVPFSTSVCSDRHLMNRSYSVESLCLASHSSRSLSASVLRW